LESRESGRSFPEAVSKRQPVASNRLTCDSKGEAGLSHSFSTRFFSPAFLALLAMALWTSSPIRLPLLFDNSREVVLDSLQPHQAVEPTVPELGMLILGAAVYITHISKENDHRAIRHLHGGNNCEVAASPANAKFG
jgi:hypothetical protein